MFGLVYIHKCDAALRNAEGYAFCETYSQEDGSFICYQYGTRAAMEDCFERYGLERANYKVVPLPANVVLG